MKTPIETLIKALRILANDIQSDDGVANAAISEAANRLEEQKNQIQRLVEAGCDLDNHMDCSCGEDLCGSCLSATEVWIEAKEGL